MNLSDILNAIRGSQQQVGMTPPTFPGGAPQISVTPGRYGLAQILADGLAGGLQPNTAGGGGADIARAFLGGMQGAQSRRQHDSQVKLQVAEMNRKANNDQILAEERKAKAQKELADAEATKAKAIADAAKKPKSMLDLYNEALSIPGTTPEMARDIAHGRRPMPAAAAGETIPLRTEIAQSIMHVPMQDVNKPAPMPTPVFPFMPGTSSPWPAAQDGTYPAKELPPSVDVPRSVANAAVNTFESNRKSREALDKLERDAGNTKPKLVTDESGKRVYAYLKDGVPQEIDTGGKVFQPSRRDRGASPGGKAGSAGGISRSVARTIETRKDSAFGDVKKMIEKDPSQPPAQAIRLAMDAQARYETEIEKATGVPLDPAKKAADRAAVERMVMERFALANSTPGQGSSPASAPPVRRYIPGKGFE